MRADRELTFELTDDLRNRIFNVHGEDDASRLLHRLGVHDVYSGLVSRDFEYIAGCIRSSEHRYGRAPLDFSDDPFKGLGKIVSSGASFWRRSDYERPVVGIAVSIRTSSARFVRVGVHPLRAEPDEVTLPEGVAEVDSFAFVGCQHILKVTIPSTMREIPAGAFWGCTGIRKFVVPEGVTSIGPAAFAGCENLRRVVLPSSLEHVGCGAFRGCTSLEEVIAPAELAVSRAAHAFEGCKLPAESYCQQTDQPIDRDRALQELEMLLDGFTRMRLDGPNSAHSFVLEQIETPGPNDVDEMAGDAAGAIHRMLEAAVDCVGGLFADDYVKTTEDDLLLLSRLVVDALEGVSRSVAELQTYECSGDVWDECEKACSSITGARAIRAGDEWYVLYADWSD